MEFFGMDAFMGLVWWVGLCFVVDWSGGLVDDVAGLDRLSG